jgi:hypothetical protein
VSRWLVILTLWTSFGLAPASPSGAAPVAVLVGAGDIASCDLDSDSATAALLASIQGTVFTLGDNVYDEGSATEFAECYDPTWGQYMDRTRPAAGNHDYATKDASAYFAYFGTAAGDPAKGYYSYDLGSWHIVVVNSNCDSVGGCDAESDQAAWLRDDLAKNPTDCTLAYWHHPRFSSGPHGDTLAMEPIWAILYDAGAEIVLSGHDHLYERFAPQNPAGELDSALGIRQFTVGTGGASLYKAPEAAKNSEVLETSTFGVLELTLREDRYEWRFVPADGGTFTDNGSGTCH